MPCPCDQRLFSTLVELRDDEQVLLFPAMKLEVVRPPGDSAPAAGAAAAAAAPAVAAAAEILSNGSAAVRSVPARPLLAEQKWEPGNCYGLLPQRSWHGHVQGLQTLSGSLDRHVRCSQIFGRSLLCCPACSAERVRQ